MSAFQRLQESLQERAKRLHNLGRKLMGRPSLEEAEDEALYREEQQSLKPMDAEGIHRARRQREREAARERRQQRQRRTTYHGGLANSYAHEELQ